MPIASIANDERVQKILLSEEQIRDRVDALAAEIVRDYTGRAEIHVVGVLKGAFVFMADLGRAIRRHDGPSVHFHFLRASTYGSELKSTGETSRKVRLEMMPPNLCGKDVLLVEDILDQGFTLSRIRDALLDEEGAQSVKLCVMLDKMLDDPAPEVVALREKLIPDYAGFQVPDRWLVGYGLDVAEEFRDWPCVAVVREACFQGEG